MTTAAKQYAIKGESVCMVARPSRRGGFRALLRAIMDWLIPVGYEDESGFHYGVRRS